MHPLPRGMNRMPLPLGPSPVLHMTPPQTHTHMQNKNNHHKIATGMGNASVGQAFHALTPSSLQPYPEAGIVTVPSHREEAGVGDTWQAKVRVGGVQNAVWTGTRPQAGQSTGGQVSEVQGRGGGPPEQTQGHRGCRANRRGKVTSVVCPAGAQMLEAAGELRGERQACWTRGWEGERRDPGRARAHHLTWSLLRLCSWPHVLVSQH